jgi:hypothetical protein
MFLAESGTSPIVGIVGIVAGLVFVYVFLRSAVRGAVLDALRVHDLRIRAEREGRR